MTAPKKAPAAKKAAPKKPQDRKPKAGGGVEKIDVTVDGLTVTVDPRRFTDWRFQRQLRKVQKGDYLVAVDLIEGAFGEEQLDKIEAHLEDEEGFIDEQAIAKFVNAAIEAAVSPNS